MISKIGYNVEEYRIEMLDRRNDRKNSSDGSKLVNAVGRYGHGEAQYCFKKYHEEKYYGIEEVAKRIPVHKDRSIVAITESVTHQGRVIYEGLRSVRGKIHARLKVFNITRNLVVEIKDSANAINAVLDKAMVSGDLAMIVGESFVHVSAFQQSILRLLIDEREKVVLVLTCRSRDVVEAMLRVSKVVSSSRLHVIRPMRPRIRIDEVEHELMKLLYKYW